MTLLSEINKKDLKGFKSDFKELLRVSLGINKAFKKLENVEDYLKKLKKVIKLFNKKYSGLKLELNLGLEEVNLKIILNEKEVRAVFDNASKIPNLSGLGLNSFNKNVESIADKSDQIKDKAYISYFDPEKGSSTVYLEKYKDQVKLVYDEEQVGKEDSAQFILCAYYACKDGVKEDGEDVYSLLASMGFIDLLSGKEFHNWMDKFRSYWGE